MEPATQHVTHFAAVSQREGLEGEGALFDTALWGHLPWEVITELSLVCSYEHLQ